MRAGIRRFQFGISLVAMFVLFEAASADDAVDDLLLSARTTAKAAPQRAVDLAGQAIAAAPEDARGYLLRADLYALLRRPAEAIADYDRAIKLAPNQAELYDRRGSEQFKAGKIEESIADFDRFLALRPDQEPFHWKRGISYYYAGRFADGRKQFEGYQTVDDNDVENAVWRYLCMARSVGVEQARGDILKIRRDPRVPMMQIYDLYRGAAKPEEVLGAANGAAGVPKAIGEEDRNQRLFYAHLYLGLYYEAAGDTQKAAQHIYAAEKHPIGHYMWDVAHVHAERLRAAKSTGEQ